MNAGDLVINRNDDIRLNSEPWNIYIGMVVGFAGAAIKVNWGDNEVMHYEDELRQVELSAVG